MILSSMLKDFLAFGVAYLVGAMPLGYWYAWFLYGIDVRQHGSGNIGATNVARVLGRKQHFIIVFLLDFLRAAVALYLLRTVSTSWVIPATGLLLGNSCSIFLAGRGGKGVATFCGILAIGTPFWLILTVISVWFLVMRLTGVNGIASLVAVIATPLIYCSMAPIIKLESCWFLVGAAAWIVWLHRSNIRALGGYKPRER